MTSAPHTLQNTSKAPAEMWCEVRSEYFPPESEIVWAFDGQTVCPAIWVWDWEPSKTLEDSVWKDTHGNHLQVTYWAAFDDSPYAPPQAPSLLTSPLA